VKLSVVIPAHNEEDCVVATLRDIAETLDAAKIDFEVIVVDDASVDETAARVAEVSATDPRISCVRSTNPPGFGFAIRMGLDAFTGDAVAIMMADGSDAAEDLVQYYGVLDQGYDCAFGSRFMRGSKIHDYPKFKLALNRFVNFGIRMLFRHGYNDTTNAFKAYRREAIDTMQPLLSHHFNLTVEMPLKAIIRGHSYVIVPISWRNREAGVSKLSLKEMGSRYAFIILYSLLEHRLSRGDYIRRDPDLGGGRSRPRSVLNPTRLGDH
jgi:dolichol-phosphate mannosyltransferase